MSTTLAVHAALSEIQNKLVATKDAYNSFGKYHYRSAESILTNLKPLLPPGATITFSDDVRYIGDRHYVVTTASFNYKGESISATSWAREPEIKKGCDAAQITGGSISYARKYALGALLIIDDNQDPDATSKQNFNDKEYQGDEFLFQKELNWLRAHLKENDLMACAGIWADLGKEGRDAQTAVYKMLSEKQKEQLKIMLTPAQPPGVISPDEINNVVKNMERQDGVSYSDDDDGYNF